MKKIIKHKWTPQDGFRIDKCEHCGAIRKWDQGFGRIIYMTASGNGPYFWAPCCKRVGMFCDVIHKN